MLPETRYAKSGDVHIAYQVIGSGPFDLVFVPCLSRMSIMSGTSPAGPASWNGPLHFRA